MSFKSILDTVGSDIKKVFSFLGSSKGQVIVGGIESGIEAIDPALSGMITLVNTWMAEILKTQALATAAGAQSGSSAQKAAITLNAVTPQALAFAQQQGLSTPTADKLNEVNTALVTIFNAFGVEQAGTAPAPTTPVVVTQPVGNASI